LIRPDLGALAETALGANHRQKALREERTHYFRMFSDMGSILIELGAFVVSCLR
jgi:hypothetical protein